MSFSNRIIYERVRGKPHIVFIDGFWRVSPKPDNIYGFRVNIKRWEKAHSWAHYQNQQLIKERFHKGEPK